MNAGVRILGVLFLVLGVTFFVLGMSETSTFANRFLKQMAGEYSSGTTFYIFGGITMIVIGAGILLTRFFKRK